MCNSDWGTLPSNLLWNCLINMTRLVIVVTTALIPKRITELNKCQFLSTFTDMKDLPCFTSSSSLLLEETHAHSQFHTGKLSQTRLFIALQVSGSQAGDCYKTAFGCLFQTVLSSLPHSGFYHDQNPPQTSGYTSAWKNEPATNRRNLNNPPAVNLQGFSHFNPRLLPWEQQVTSDTTLQGHMIVMGLKKVEPCLQKVKWYNSWHFSLLASTALIIKIIE